MAEIHDYTDLIAWQKSRKLVLEVYRLLSTLPKEEQFALASQIKRAVISIPSNIAEGYGRGYRSEYTRFLSIARGSCYELDTQMMLCVDLHYLSKQQTAPVFAMLNDIKRLITALLKSLNAEST